MQLSVRYSQNFLRDPRLVEQLVAEAAFGPDDTVLDIGAGSGSLTRVLTGHAGHVLAYEADPRLSTILKAAFATTPNVSIISGDFLEADLPTTSYKVFANIPFNRTSDIMRRLLDTPAPPEAAYIIMQREAALKYMGEPGRTSLAAMLYAPLFGMAITHTFRPHDFVPRPAVGVVLLQCTRRTRPLLDALALQRYTDLVSYVFNHANPNIFPALQKLFPNRSFPTLERAFASKLTAKPSQLSLADWLLLLDLFQATSSARERGLIANTAQKLKHEATTIEKHHRTSVVTSWRGSAAGRRSGARRRRDLQNP